MPYKSKEDQKAWFQKNKLKVYEKRKIYDWNGAAYYAEYRQKHREKLKAYISNWQKQNSHKLKAIKARRRAAKLNRTTKWVSIQEKRLIAEFYSKCPVGYEVDHIIPLQGKLVSGLHVLINLQYLPVLENRAKGNRFSL